MKKRPENYYLKYKLAGLVLAFILLLSIAPTGNTLASFEYNTNDVRQGAYEGDGDSSSARIVEGETGEPGEGPDNPGGGGTAPDNTGAGDSEPDGGEGATDNGGAGKAVLPGKASPVRATVSYDVYENTPSGLNKVNSDNALSGAVTKCTNNSPASYTIVANADDANINGSITIPAGKKITLTSSDSATDGAWTLTMTGTGRHFDVKGELTLENIVLDGNGSHGGIKVSGMGSHLTMDTGSVIRNCRAEPGNGGPSTEVGGGVLVEGNGTFDMVAGLIQGNIATEAMIGYGGGVYVGDKGTLNMSGSAKISGNFAKSDEGNIDGFAGGGGVYVANGGTFAMSGSAEISGNVANAGKGTGGGGGVYVYTHDDTFVMDGGIISGNHATTGDPDENQLSTGGGVYFRTDGRNDGTGKAVIFTMNGGEISGNDAQIGGGVMIDQSGGVVFKMTGGKITNNTAAFGGGVGILGGDFEMSGESEVSGNLSNNAYSLKPTIISKLASSYGVAPGDGGGVGAAATGTVHLTGNAVVKDNEAGSDGGGICMADGKYNFGIDRLTVEKDVIFSGNTAKTGWDLGLNAVYKDIKSPAGPYYSYASNSPVNNYDIGLPKITITVVYQDENGLITAPAPVSAKTYAMKAAVGLPLVFDDTGYRIISISGYELKGWAFNGQSEGDGVGKFENDQLTIYKVPKQTNSNLTLTYTKVTTQRLTVTNDILGTYADMTKKFKFTVYKYSDSLGNNPVVVDEFYLGNKESNPRPINIDVSTNMGVVMEADPGYDTAVNGASKIPGGNLISTGISQMGGSARTFTFENTKTEVVPVGVFYGIKGVATPLMYSGLIILLAFIFAFTHRPQKIR